MFRIEKVIKRGKKKSLVKWKGYSDDFNSWVDNKDILDISDIDFIVFILKRNSSRKDDRDAVNKTYVDKKLSLPSLIGPKPIITVWAEEKGSLGDGHYEFSFGNGSSESEHAYGGYCMSAPGRIIRGSLTATESRIILSEEVKVNIVVDGKEQVNESLIKKNWRYLQLYNFPRSNRIKAI